jgi:hypothetical protein
MIVEGNTAVTIDVRRSLVTAASFPGISDPMKGATNAPLSQIPGAFQQEKELRVDK